MTLSNHSLLFHLWGIDGDTKVSDITAGGLLLLTQWTPSK
jgi:hypothetical protein